MKKILSITIFLIAITIALLNTGCASPASRMVPESFDVNKKHTSSIKIEKVHGGGENEYLQWKSQIPNSWYLQALKESIDASEAFETLIESGDADYELSVNLSDYETPLLGGFNITIEFSSRWSIVETKTKTVVYDDVITTSHTTEFGESLIGQIRLNKAVEGSVRANIKEGIKRLSELDL